MNRRVGAAVVTGALLLSSLATAVVLVPAAATLPGGAQGAADLALANVGKGAGTCSTYNPAPNTLGGTSFGSSCTGANGQPEYWCADFAKWVWASSGLYVGGLTPAAASFVTSGAGLVHTSVSYVPVPGDAVVYDFDGVAYADHVGIVTSVNGDGSVTTVNGDFSGAGTGAAFARTSHVQVATIGARHRAVGQTPGSVGMTITEYVTPHTAPPASPAAVVDVSGVPNLFWRSPSGKLLHTYELGGIWAAPEALDSGIWGDPAASALPDVVYRTNEGTLLRAFFDGNSWQTGQVLPIGGVRLASDPSVAVDGNGIENVFFEGADHMIWHDYVVNGTWIGPAPIATAARSGPSAITTSSGGLDVFFASAGHVLAHSNFNAGAWSGTVPLTSAPATIVGSPSATRGSDGVEHVAWLSTTSAVLAGTLSAGVWSVAAPSGAMAHSIPSALAVATSLHVVAKVRGAPSIQDDLFDGSAWSGGQAVTSGSGVPGHPALFLVGGSLTVVWLTAQGELDGASTGGSGFGPITVIAAP